MGKLFRMKHIPGYEDPDKAINSGFYFKDFKMTQGDWIIIEGKLAFECVQGGGYGKGADDTLGALFRRWEIEP